MNKFNTYIYKSLCALCDSSATSVVKTFLITSILLGTTFLACKKEQPKINNEVKDPCECASEVSADFVIEEISQWGYANSYFTETDTVFRSKGVRFTASEDNAEYLWFVGSEKLSEKSVERFFDSEWAENDIPITLVVKKETNATCFPNDDGYDSITKSFYISKYRISDFENNNVEAGIIEGLFRVSEENENDSIDIGIDFVYGSSNRLYINVYNYDGEGTECIETLEPSLTGFNYRELRSTRITDITCNKLQFGITVLDVTEVEMYFKEHEHDKEYHYKGRRLGPF